ncbi:MAG: hypothetical protein HOE54_10445, partial [Gammaproteobacteria bacterium]|nr:hypothetical protein [Gammaproteobacteria bacterium]
MSDKQLFAVHAVVLSVLLALAYHEVRNHYFVWDTIPFVLENPWIHEWTFDNVIAMFTKAHMANWQPVVLLSHALDFTLFGNNAGLHHLTNLVLHIANALLLYALISRILLLTGRPARLAGWIGFLTALIFGLHPQHVESVAWVAERKDVLYSFFALISLLLYLKYSGTGEKRPASLIWPFVFFCISIAAKPMAVTLPVILLLLDIYPLNRCKSPSDLAALIIEKLHYFLVTAIVIVITLTTQSLAMPDAVDLPLWARALNAIDNTLFYVAGYVWPVDLSPFYPYPQDAAYLQSASFWLPGLLFLLATSVVTVWMFYRGVQWPLLLFAFYLVTLSPVSGLIHVGPAKATDHYVYLATIPFSLLTALAIAWGWTKADLAKLLSISLTILYLVSLLLMTQLQVTYWNNPLTLWSRVAQLYPESPFAHRNLAAAYVQLGDPQQALHH